MLDTDIHDVCVLPAILRFCFTLLYTITMKHFISFHGVLMFIERRYFLCLLPGMMFFLLLLSFWHSVSGGLALCNTDSFLPYNYVMLSNRCEKHVLRMISVCIINWNLCRDIK